MNKSAILFGISLMSMILAICLNFKGFSVEWRLAAFLIGVISFLVAAIQTGTQIKTTSIISAVAITMGAVISFLIYILFFAWFTF